MIEDGDVGATLGAPGPASIGRSGRRAGLWAFVAFALTGSLIVAYWIVSDSRRQPPAAAAATPGAPAPTIGHHYAPVVAGPADKAMEALRLHSVALVDGDEAGWLAAVDPGQAALVARYKGVYRSLRTLGVTRYSYTRNVGSSDKANPSVLTIPVRTDYCLGADTCADGYPASVMQTLTMRPVGGKYVITAVADPPSRKDGAPVAWQAGTLQFVQGRRTVVGAEPGEAKHLAEYLALAEQAAAADDPFAASFLTQQTRYRVYLAGEKQWKRWYGGGEDWAVGFAHATSASGFDVVLRVARLDTAAERLVTMKHELGHVITLTGGLNYRARDRWLREGIAEYIGWAPKTAKDSYRRASVKWAVRRKKLTTMVPAWPGDKASDRAGDAFYGLSHYAVDCLAQTYGREKMIRFARQILLHDESYDAAARDAFTKPFAAVDKSCAAWIRQHA